MKPTIGVTRCSRLDDYLSSVEQAGGRARVLEVSESPRKLLDEIDGLLLTGGGDIDPVLYGEDRHPTVEDAEPGRDEFEIDLARRAMAADLPLLAICRGAQVLNVAAGGTLVQDIPSTVTPTSRTASSSRRAPTRMPSTSRLGRDSNRRSASRSTRTHVPRQQPAPPVRRPCRVRPDPLGHGARRRRRGDRKARTRAFCVGVQWHPENFWRTGEFAPLFDTFVERRAGASERASGRKTEPRVAESGRRHAS